VFTSFLFRAEVRPDCLAEGAQGTVSGVGFVALSGWMILPVFA